MTETLSPVIEDITRRYLAVWSEPDPAVRRAAVAGLWAPDGVEFVDGKQFRGLDELDTRVAGAYAAFIGNGMYALTGGQDVSVHGDIAAFTVHLAEDDGEAGLDRPRLPGDRPRWPGPGGLPRRGEAAPARLRSPTARSGPPGRSSPGRAGGWSARAEALPGRAR